MHSILSLLVALPSLVSATCSTFKPLTGTTFTSYENDNTNITISEVNVCPAGNFSCWVGSSNTSPPLGKGNWATVPLLIGGIVTVNRTIGITTNADGSDSGIYNTGNYLSSDAVSNLFTLISSSTGMTFPQNVVGNLTGGSSFGQPAGTSGYAVFRPDLNCVRGVLSGCSGDGYPQIDTAIEACAPVQPATGCSGSYGCGPAGTKTFVQIPANESSQVTCWPCEVELKLTGAAGMKSSVNMVMLAGFAVGVLAWVGW
jgi:hypothetical protein